MFPYINTTRWQFGSFAIHPFVGLVAIGIAAGYLVAVSRAKRNGIDREQFTKLGLCVVAAAFIGGHFGKFIYSPGAWRLVLAYPSAALELLNGQASFGAFFGGYIAALLFLLLNRIPYRDWYLYADSACFAVPFAWWIGRVGCYLVHDHPGIRTTSWLGVKYPGGTRYDLGLLEMLFLIALAGVFLFLDRKPRPRGFYYVAFMFAYGAFRVLLDQLHVDPPRYGGWTVDQIFGSFMIFGAVITLIELHRLERSRRVGALLPRLT